MTLNQLKTIYRIQFPVLQSYEKDTWYDANGRIVFSAKNYGDLTYKRPEFENPNVVTPIRRGDAPWDGIMKHAPAGYVFARTITDDTMPAAPSSAPSNMSLHSTTATANKTTKQHGSSSRKSTEDKHERKKVADHNHLYIRCDCSHNRSCNRQRLCLYRL